MSSKTTQFQDAPPSAPPYKKIIENAKARAGQDRPGPLQNTPRFDQMENRSMSTETQPQAAQSTLSEKSVEGLRALAAAQPRPAPVPEPEAATEEKTESPAETPDPIQTDDEKLRAKVESRLREIDIGQYLLGGGEVTQLVPIVPGKLEVKFRTITEYEEGWVDSYLGRNKDLTNRQFLRAMNECSLAFYIDSVNGVTWPPATGRDGQVIPQNIDERLSRVRKMNSTIFALFVQNLGWFVERVSKALTLEALGNG
jgi:hypothetical protein